MILGRIQPKGEKGHSTKEMREEEWVTLKAANHLKTVDDKYPVLRGGGSTLKWEEASW